MWNYSTTSGLLQKLALRVKGPQWPGELTGFASQGVTSVGLTPTTDDAEDLSQYDP